MSNRLDIIGNMMKNWLKAMMIVAACGVFLGGCGQKGDLYLPDSETAADEEDKENEENEENTE